MNAAIDSAQVANHRKLRFHSIDEANAEVDRIVQAAGEGRLRTLGNWSPGQIMAHIAAWIEYSYDGFPLGPPPFFVRWILRWQLKKYLRDGMPRGVQIPRVEKGTYGADDMTTAEAAERLKRAFARLKDEPAKFASPVFGELSQQDRIQLNLRHAELHLGYLDY